MDISQTLSKSNYIERFINTKVDIEKSIPFGFSSDTSGTVNNKTKTYTYGKRNIEENLPFNSDSIYRMASQSKFMGTVGFLKLIDKGLVTWDTPLKDFLPEFAAETMGVIQPYEVKSYEKLLINPLFSFKDSNIITIHHEDHPFSENDWVSLEWSNGLLDIGKCELPTVNGIPGFQIFNVFSIFGITRNTYNIQTAAKATNESFCGGFVKIKKVITGVKRSIFLSPDKMLINPKVKTYYYKLIPLKRELTILDILTHGLGWSYYAYAMLYMSFGYSKDPIKSNIQAGIWNELGIPVGVPLNCFKCGIREWSRLASNVPLLYQPGEDWSYGPQLSLLGALIETIDGRSLETYMNEELWLPLGMRDTGFFIRDQEKKERLCELYVNIPKIVLKFMGRDIIYQFAPIQEAQKCIYEGPQSLCFIDGGMYTTVNDYLKFLGSLLDGDILSKEMINIISEYETCFDVSNLGSVASYSSGMGLSNSGIVRDGILKNLKWGLGVGKVRSGIITWAGVFGTRFLIDFNKKIAYNVGTNVIGPPAGSFDVDLIELNYKTMNDIDYNLILSELFL